jgi:anaerobic selenocysteine-containing dehydrogenase
MAGLRRVARSDEVLLIRPGSDAALALAVMHVIVTEKLYDAAFVGSHTTGFLESHSKLPALSVPRWGRGGCPEQQNRLPAGQNVVMLSRTERAPKVLSACA